MRQQPGRWLCVDDEISKLLCAGHEQGAGHAAQGYARVTGKPGIVLVTSGPGVPAPAPAIALQRELT